MAEALLTLDMTEGARIAYSSLREDDQRLLDAWFDHLRHWQDSEYIRANSRLIDPAEQTYLFPRAGDFVIAFKISGNAVVIVSIFRGETVRKFAQQAEPSLP
jgi:hypothetical protein